MSDFVSVIFRCGAGLLGAMLIVVFFKSIIRVGILNQRYQDPVAFWTGRVILYLFRFRIAIQPGARARRNDIMTWYWPCMLIGIITAWFVLVMFGFALLNLALASEKNLSAALVSSGSALSTLGFATPNGFGGQILAIFEGGIGLFLVVYLFTFLPGFMDLIRERGDRVAWIYHRTGRDPSGVGLLVWLARNNRLENLAALWADWSVFFHTLSNSRSFLPVLCVVRPLTPENSWVCAFGAFLDALALMNTTVAGATEDVKICFENGVSAFHNTHHAMRGTPIIPKRDPANMHVTRAEYDAACAQLEAVGVTLVADRQAAWQRFVEAHLSYEQEIAWLAAAISDPVPKWPGGAAS